MYSDFWGFRKDPFSLIADVALVCQSRQHDQALASLIYSVHSKKGLTLLTAEPGMGKTTLLYCLKEFLDARDVQCLFLHNSRVNSDQFWELIGSNLTPPCDGKSKVEILSLLQDSVFDSARGDAVLIVDEVQNFGSDVLEEIRLLGNLESRYGKLLQIVLAGQPEFESKLDASGLYALKQRVVRRCSLRPFNERQTHSYICARLECAGVQQKTIFPEDVIAQIHVRSRGIPRLINTLCENLLVTAFALNTKVTTLDMLDTVTSDLRLAWNVCDSGDDMTASRVDEDDGRRIDMTRLNQMSVLPAGFGEATEQVPAETSGQLGMFDSRPCEPDPILSDEGVRKSSLPSILHSNEIESAGKAMLAAKTMLGLPGRVCIAVRHLWNKLRAPVRAAIRHPRVARGLLGTALGLFCVVAFSRPITHWLKTLPTVVASLHSTQRREIARVESDSAPAPVSSESGTSTRPTAVRIDPAEYTPSARNARFQGKVFVVVTVNTQGKVVHVDFATPTAFDLDLAIRVAAQRWLFKPAVRNGQTIESRTLVQVPFR